MALDSFIASVVAGSTQKGRPAGSRMALQWLTCAMRCAPSDSSRATSASWECAAALVAPLELQARPQVQVALTFPPFRHRPGAGHVDGLNPPEPDGRPGTFTMLGGIVLSDQTRDDMGNLFVWPGSHVRIAGYLREHGVEALVATGGSPPIEQGEPVQVHAAPGDLLLASYLLWHNIGGNVSSIVRKTLYYRLHVAGHELHWRQALTDALAEFPPARATTA